MAKRQKDIFTREWITNNAIKILSEYEKGILTIRGLHYQLVGIGMTNSIQHYKRVVAAMGVSRWSGLVEFDVFSDRDRDRAVVGHTPYDETFLDEKIETAKEQIGLWMSEYSKNRWENQIYYPEVFIEKKALEGVFNRPCRQNGVALGACKGYPSLTFLHEASWRFRLAERAGKKPIIIYFGDYDPSGEDIPRAIEENIKKMGCDSIEVRRIALMHEQVIEWGLPPAPTKETDSRTANWDGIGQVELDAVRPEKLTLLLQEAIDAIFDYSRYNELKEIESEEKIEFQSVLKKFVSSL